MNMRQRTVKSECFRRTFPLNIWNLMVNSVFGVNFRYKEGRVILEQALIAESEGFPDPYSTQPTASNRYSNQNQYQE